MAVINSTDKGFASQFEDGAQAMRQLMLQLESAASCRDSEGADFNVLAVADRILPIFSTIFSGPDQVRKGALIALVDFIGSAMEGCTPYVVTWNPMERLSTSV